MKKTFILLAVTAFVLNATPGMAKDIETRPYVSYLQSPTLGTTIAQGATLINSTTGHVVVFDINENPPVESPFNIEMGHIYWDFELANKYNESIELDDLSLGEDDTLILDFTKQVNLGGPTEAEYVIIMFRSMTETGDNFAEWYENNSVSITGRFNNGDYAAYIIADACDMADSGTTYGGLVFFNKSVENAVLLAEAEPTVTISVPEPTTATLSLLALAGLAVRRRR